MLRSSIRYWLLGLLLYCSLAEVSVCFAMDGMTIIVSEEGGAYSELAGSLASALSKSASKIKIKTVPLQNIHPEDLARSPSNQLLIAVGSAAMHAMTQRQTTLPVLCVMVARDAFQKTIQESSKTNSHTFSAIYLDQPWGRQLNLIQQTLGGNPRIGVLLSANDKDSLTALNYVTKANKVVLVSEILNEDSELLPSIRSLLSNSDALLAVPDPTIYNRNNIQTILLSSYRQRTPLFGFSPAYVKAGALAAVFSTPAQIGQQIAEIVQSSSSNLTLPAPQYPKYYSVAVNPQVAHALELNIDTEQDLLMKLQQATERAP